MANISSIADDLGISNDKLPSMSGDRQDVLAEFITVVADRRNIARQPDVDRKEQCRVLFMYCM